MKLIFSLADLKEELAEGPSDCLSLPGIRGGKNWPHLPFYPFPLSDFFFPSFPCLWLSPNRPGLVGGELWAFWLLLVSGETQDMPWGLFWGKSHLYAVLGDHFWVMRARSSLNHNKHLSGITGEWYSLGAQGGYCLIYSRCVRVCIRIDTRLSKHIRE